MKPHTLRQSSIKTWLDCKAKYYAQYILGLNLGETEPPLWWGVYVHKQIEDYHLGNTYDEDIVAPYAAFYPRVEGEQVEVSFRFTPVYHGESLPVPVTGVIDRVLPSVSLYDLKTSKTAWSQRRADEDLQATLYCYYWWQVHGELLPFTFVVYRKDWTPKSRFSKIQEVTTTRSEADFERLWLLMYKVIDDISNEESWNCQCKTREHQIWATA